MSCCTERCVLPCSLLARRVTSVAMMQRRWKYKPKWATNRKHKSPSDFAMDHFDTFYEPVYGKLWPSIRIALLSKQKYCALINNFSTENPGVQKIHDLGARNIFDIARKTIITSYEKKASQLLANDVRSLSEDAVDNDNLVDQTDEDLPKTNKSLEGDFGDVESRDSPIEETNINTSIYDFMPTKQVFSEKELLRQEEIRQSIYEPSDIQLTVIPDPDLLIPQHLKALAFGKGNISRFPAPKQDGAGLLGYYLLDAASILPVVALGVARDDEVLDLCAAPGGKTLAILQTLMTENITCNDHSYSRLSRLKEVLHWYVTATNTINCIYCHTNGCHWDESVYDKVLVDVPCNTDRHVVMDDENNIFRPIRLDERLNMTTLQRDLLVAGIKSCKPGGAVVYSTCTLSPAQNDGVVQAASEFLWENTKIDIVVQDTSGVADAFKGTFKFFNGCRFGQLVIPTLTSNFGPMYFCKIRRLR